MDRDLRGVLRGVNLPVPEDFGKNSRPAISVFYTQLSAGAYNGSGVGRVYDRLSGPEEDHGTVPDIEHGVSPRPGRSAGTFYPAGVGEKSVVGTQRGIREMIFFPERQLYHLS